MKELYFFWVGASLASFVCCQIKRKGKDASLRSHCDRCGHPLSLMELIPLVGYLMVKGRCRYCGCQIPLIYPLMEGLCGILCLFLAKCFLK